MSETHKATETCSCGSRIELEGVYDLAKRLSEWRENHRHVAPATSVAKADESTPTDAGSVTTTASAPRGDGRPPVFGFSPRWRL